MLLTDSKEDAEKVRKWSTQSRENAPWYQHEELGYNYRMSNDNRRRCPWTVWVSGRAYRAEKGYL